MMLLYDLPALYRTILLGIVFLILLLTMMLLAESIYQRMYRGFSVLFFLIVIVNYVFFQLCLDEKYNMSFWGVALYIVVMVLFDFVIIRQGIKYRQENFTIISVKQGLDAMEEGICFYTTNGLPQFTNKSMNAMSITLTGKTIDDASAFWKGLKSKKINKNSEIILNTEDMVIVKTPEKVCAFSNRNMESELVEMVMVDITSEYKTYEELLSKTEALEQQQERLKEYNKNVTSATIERELLNAKVHIHDELGEILLAAKRYIQAGDTDRNTLTALWLRNLSLLGAERQKDVEDEYEEISRAASDIGMNIVVTGELPQYGKAKSITASALHECLTNTFRHAGGDTVYVDVKDTDTGIILTFSNNGDPPAGQIEERGGLKHLREITEDAGYSMKIETKNGYKMIITI